MPMAATSPGRAPAAAHASLEACAAALQDLVGVVLDPSRARRDLAVLPLRGRDDAAGPVEQQAAAARGALVERGDVARAHRSNSWTRARASSARPSEASVVRRASTSSTVSAHSRSRAQRPAPRPPGRRAPAARAARAGRARLEQLERVAAVKAREVLRARDLERRMGAQQALDDGIRIGGAGQRRGRALQPAQAEVAAQPLECVERDPAERRVLAARDREHAAAAALEHGLPARGGRLALTLRQYAHPGEAREDAIVLDHARLDRRARLAHDLLDVVGRDLEHTRIPLVWLVGGADEQRPLPRIRELHASVRKRRRQRGAPRLVQAHDQMRALGEAHRPRRGGIGHAP